MLFRLFLAALFVPVGWGLHLSHLRVRQKVDVKINLNQQVNLAPPMFLQTLTMGFDSLMADLLWLQLIQYYGAASVEKVAPTHLYQYFDTITSLDPDFEDAYILSGYLLNETPKEKEQALKIMQKGEKNNPKSWLIVTQLGFYYYLYVKDTQKAADTFARAASLPGAPESLSGLAAQLYKRSNQLERCQLSVKLWQNNVQAAPSPELKQRAEQHLIETVIYCDLLALRKALQDYLKQADARWQDALKQAKLKKQPPPKAPATAPPATLQALVQAGLINRVPQDPFKRAYVYRQNGLSVKVQPLPWKPIDLKAADVAN